MVLKKTKGFLTIGKTTYSYFFKLFTVNGDRSLSFVCNFTVCDTKCNGPSCFARASGRKRRDQPGICQQFNGKVRVLGHFVGFEGPCRERSHVD
ncbi:vitelline envelope sperm lysin receptor-like isoform X1 [Haliotis rubra]|uniref:vitelline envelope sperm lysin receptor-like isoform X1 n=1 Tax=Haliotis rubra TaxID=36100 RepID=UPI001EE57F03|nr:vitelline envelope sperm lysin receptor-like isoform X1 [Haliotis rubra]